MATDMLKLAEDICMGPYRRDFQKKLYGRPEKHVVGRVVNPDEKELVGPTGEQGKPRLIGPTEEQGVNR